MNTHLKRSMENFTGTSTCLDVLIFFVMSLTYVLVPFVFFAFYFLITLTRFFSKRREEKHYETDVTCFQGTLKTCLSIYKGSLNSSVNRSQVSPKFFLYCM